MSTVNINTTNNTVSVIDTNQTVFVTDNNKSTTVSITQPNTNVVQVNTPGPQGPQGTGGGGTPINTGSFATTGSNVFVGNLTLLNVCSSLSSSSEKSWRFSLLYLRGLRGSGFSSGTTSGMDLTLVVLKYVNSLFKKSRTLSASECARATMHFSP